MRNVKTGQNYMKNSHICHYLATNGKLWVLNKFSPHMYVSSTRDDLVKVSRKLNAWKCQNQVTYPYFDQLSERYHALSTPCFFVDMTWSGEIISNMAHIRRQMWQNFEKSKNARAKYNRFFFTSSIRPKPTWEFSPHNPVFFWRRPLTEPISVPLGSADQ